MLFNITFGQYHPLRDGFITIEARDKAQAREAAFRLFGPRWCGCYDDVAFESGYHQLGRLGGIVNAETIIEVGPVLEVAPDEQS